MTTCLSKSPELSTPPRTGLYMAFGSGTLSVCQIDGKEVIGEPQRILHTGYPPSTCIGWQALFSGMGTSTEPQWTHTLRHEGMSCCTCTGEKQRLSGDIEDDLPRFRPRHELRMTKRCRTSCCMSTKKASTLWWLLALEDWKRLACVIGIGGWDTAV